MSDLNLIWDSVEHVGLTFANIVGTTYRSATWTANTVSLISTVFVRRIVISLQVIGTSYLITIPEFYVTLTLRLSGVSKHNIYLSNHRTELIIDSDLVACNELYIDNPAFIMGGLVQAPTSLKVKTYYGYANS